MKRKVILLVGMMAVLIATSANAGVIVAENFGGDGSGGLDGTAADTFSAAITAAGGSGTWVADGGFLDNGSVSANKHAAYLNLGSYMEDAKGTAAGLFDLTMTMSETTGAWLSLGFAVQNTPSTERDFTGGTTGSPTLPTTALGTIVYRDQAAKSGELDMWAGPGTANGVDGPEPNTGDRILTVTWDFTPAGGYGSSNYGTVTWSDSVLGELGSYPLGSDKTFGSILITGAANSTGTISDLTLSQVPEPATVGLLVLGGLMGLRRRRK